MLPCVATVNSEHDLGRVDTLTPLIEKESAAFETSTAATISNKPVRRGSKEQCAVDRGKKSSTDASATPTDFELLVVIVSKEYLVKKNYIGNMQTERDIMTKVDHPFLVKLKYAFQSPANVYLVMPYIPGGELFHTLHKQGLLLEVTLWFFTVQSEGRPTQHTACFYAAEMVLALEYLHGQGIIHR
ncbi:hypothetical protein DYB32_004690 [Aphanomyces invadans]|uniref:Protein kinase domain-containing protein n=1 Tax=Aphanomyces invadans TaxID=157072 RepID=A0A418AWS8_9STRA|nr:hypothetical protein DYB32_004690 [Aphanomyces invadans]